MSLLSRVALRAGLAGSGGDGATGRLKSCDEDRTDAGSALSPRVSAELIVLLGNFKTGSMGRAVFRAAVMPSSALGPPWKSAPVDAGLSVKASAI